MSNFNPLQLALRPLIEKARQEDPLFDAEVASKESRTEKPKTWDECCEYIMGEAYEYANAHKQGNFGLAGMSDTDLQSLIKHYYDEDNIEIKKVGSNVKIETAQVGTATAKSQPSKPAPKKAVKKPSDEGCLLFGEEAFA